VFEEVECSFQGKSLAKMHWEDCDSREACFVSIITCDGRQLEEDMQQPPPLRRGHFSIVDGH